jgi:putative acetyltransferase
VSGNPTLRPYTLADQEATIELWRRTWQAAYPAIDFAARVDWWRARWRDELLPVATVTIAEADDIIIGFVTVDPSTGYLDQLVVAPKAWGGGGAQALVDEAKRIAPNGLDLHVNADNARAIRFYEKHGFVIAGPDKNPISGKPVFKMSWKP